jgi:hypothetical protein
MNSQVVGEKPGAREPDTIAPVLDAIIDAKRAQRA